MLLNELEWRGAVAGACVAMFAACAGNAPPGSGAPRPPVVYMLAVPALPDSALRLARFALGEIAGAIQLPRTRDVLVTISTHYDRPRRGGGRTEVAVIAGVNREVADSAAPVTIVELRSWALDLPHELTRAERRSGVPQTAVTTNAPAIRTPRAITSADTVDSQLLSLVLAGFERHGAKRIP